MVKVASWLSQWSLKLNVSKTVCMFLSRGYSVHLKQDFFFNLGERLQVVSECTYLGVHLDSHVIKVCKNVIFKLGNIQVSNSFSYQLLFDKLV